MLQLQYCDKMGRKQCPYKKTKQICRKCNRKAYCKHDNLKRNCHECGGRGLWPHNIRKYDCKPCGGGAWCTHGISKKICKDCNGRGLCKHNKEKQRCKDYGGSALYKTPLCETQVCNRKYKGHCLRCFVHLFPDEPVIRTYKTKETTVATFVKEKFHDVTWICDRQIEGGCSRRRPDLFLDMGSHVVIVEVVENKYDEYMTVPARTGS